jgi:hypothetical protein
LEEVESSAAMKRLWISNDDDSDDDSSDSLEEETEEEEEVSSEESSMNQLDTFEEKSLAKRDRNLFFGDDGDTTLSSSEPHTPEMLSNRVHSDIDGSDDDDVDKSRST